MSVYSYLIEHDYGLAPNPFGKYCTLAVCKPKIRRSGLLKIGDWIVGTGSRALEEVSGKQLWHHVIYTMQVSEIIPIDAYWNDSRFQYKKPIVNGPLVTMYGDNIYHKDEKGKWIQENSAHSNVDGTCSEKHLETDTGGENVLIAELFYYFGNTAPQIPEDLLNICHSAIGEKKLSDEDGQPFIKWISNNFQPGIHGDPINWIEHKQQKLF
ncbi:MAG: hypothetical protein V4649_01590 [Bacteroidota bacterium]